MERLERKHDVRSHVATRRGEIKGWAEGARARRKARWRASSEGYQARQRCRRRVEEIFGWLKTIGGMRKARFVGRRKIQEHAFAAAATFNFYRDGEYRIGSRGPTESNKRKPAENGSNEPAEEANKLADIGKIRSASDDDPIYTPNSS